MRAFITCAVLTVSTLTLNAAPAFAQHSGTAQLIDSWYHRYLGRHIDPAGMHDHLQAIRRGTPLDVVEASILASPEYYARSGATPEGFIAALHRDVLGRRAGVGEFQHEVRYLLTHGRHAAALRVLSERSPVVVVRSAPVVVTRPYYVEPTVIVPSHRHHHHPVPVYVAPRPGVSIRIGIR